MNVPTQNDINRIYEGFRDAAPEDPTHFDVLNIRQLCDTDNGVRIELNDEIAKGYWELFRPNNGLLICLTDGLYHTEYHQTILPRQDIISLRFILSGKMSSTFDNIGKIDIPQASASILYTKEDQNFRPKSSGLRRAFS